MCPKFKMAKDYTGVVSGRLI
uniref:Uncharacterized protein n=1 Tax=Anguilla anguilla TaxID=7936 RepID=A0A0E9TUU3_ANGAN